MVKETASNLMFSLQLNVTKLTEAKSDITTTLKELRSICKHPRVFFLRREHHSDRGICVNCGTQAEGADVFKIFEINNSRKFFVPHSPFLYYEFRRIFDEGLYPTLKQIKDTGLNLISTKTITE